MVNKEAPRTAEAGTEGKQVDEALRESEAWLNLAEAAGGVGTFDWDIVNNSAKCSDQYFRLFGVEPSPGVSLEAFLEQVHEEDVEGVREAIERTLEHDAPYAMVYRVRWPDGSIHWLSDRAKVLKDNEGRPVRFHGAITDITERKQAEEALQRAHDALEQQIASYRSVFEAGSEGYIIHDDGVIIEVNPQFEELTGYSGPEIVGESFLKLIAEESRTLVVERMNTRPGSPFEIVGLKKDDTRIHFEVVGKDHLHQGRKVRLVSIRDITKRKQAEEALQKTRDDLETKVETEMLRGNTYGLTFRELTVLHLIAAGRADKEIASELGIRPYTASRHVKNIMGKMNATSRTDAGVRAVREKLID